MEAGSPFNRKVFPSLYASFSKKFEHNSLQYLSFLN